jgi:microsomal dipeptidase-like Zn-dependent dipeptidase
MDSQSSLLQLKEGKVRVATATIYVMEKGMSSSFMIQYVVPMLSKLHKEMLMTLPTAEYYDRLNEEIDHLLKSKDHDISKGQEFKIIRSVDDIEEDKLNLILAIEGGYSLSKTNSKLKDKLLELKNGHHKFLYMTLVHATQFKDYCTHAFSMKLVKKNPVFKPKGYGFSKQGLEIIDLAYDKTQGNRILIDVKHMSLVSRMQFYEYRKKSTTKTTKCRFRDDVRNRNKSVCINYVIA